MSALFIANKQKAARKFLRSPLSLGVPYHFRERAKNLSPLSLSLRGGERGKEGKRGLGIKAKD